MSRANEAKRRRHGDLHIDSSACQSNSIDATHDVASLLLVHHKTARAQTSGASVVGQWTEVQPAMCLPHRLCPCLEKRCRGEHAAPAVSTPVGTLTLMQRQATAERKKEATGQFEEEKIQIFRSCIWYYILEGKSQISRETSDRR